MSSKTYYLVNWTVEIADEFAPEFRALQVEVQDAILAVSRLLQHFGPHLGRPRVDTLNGSSHTNMKELRFSAADGQWRVAFAFDPRRTASYSWPPTRRAAVPRRFIGHSSARRISASSGT